MWNFAFDEEHNLADSLGEEEDQTLAQKFHPLVQKLLEGFSAENKLEIVIVFTYPGMPQHAV